MSASLTTLQTPWHSLELSDIFTCMELKVVSSQAAKRWSVCANKGLIIISHSICCLKSNERKECAAQKWKCGGWQVWGTSRISVSVHHNMIPLLFVAGATCTALAHDRNCHHWLWHAGGDWDSNCFHTSVSWTVNLLWTQTLGKKNGHGWWFGHQTNVAVKWTICLPNSNLKVRVVHRGGINTGEHRCYLSTGARHSFFLLCSVKSLHTLEG